MLAVLKTCWRFDPKTNIGDREGNLVHCLRFHAADCCRSDFDSNSGSDAVNEEYREAIQKNVKESKLVVVMIK
jgi:hypothetical protein